MTGSNRNLKHTYWYWPIAACGSAMLLLIFVGIRLLQLQYNHLLYAPSYFGFLVGLFSLVTMVGGLFGRTWISGWLLSIALVTVGTLVSWLGNDRASTSGMLQFFFLLPQLMFFSCSSLIAARVMFGWSLTTNECIAIPKQPIKIEDLLILSLVVASCFTLSKAFETPGMGPDQTQLVVFSGSCAAFSWLLLLPATALTFRTRDWRQRWTAWIVMMLITVVVCQSLNYFSAPENDFVSQTFFVCIGVLATSATLITGLSVLLACGIRLTHFAKTEIEDKASSSEQSNASCSDLEDLVQVPTEPMGVRRQSRILAAAVFNFTFLAVFFVSFYGYKELSFYRMVQSTTDPADPSGHLVELRIRDQKIVDVTFQRWITDGLLESYARGGSTYERISLSGARITDETLGQLKLFPNLKHLDLSKTQITDRGIIKLKSLPGLTSLSVAYTAVSLATAVSIANELGVRELNVSGLRLTDSHLSDSYNWESIEKLNLCRNLFTDVGLEKLLQTEHHFKSLDVSETAIDGTGFRSAAHCPAEVILDGSKVSDEGLLTLLTHNTLERISIRNTKITPAVLPTLAGRGIGLILGQGLISEQDLINLGPVKLPFLGLNDGKFAGICCGKHYITAHSLDLSDSGVFDKIIENSLSRQYFQHLNLSNTGITDNGLEHINSFEVDLRHTKVTASGIKNSKIPMKIIHHDQFKPEELVGLRKHGVMIDAESRR